MATPEQQIQTIEAQLERLNRDALPKAKATKLVFNRRPGALEAEIAAVPEVRRPILVHPVRSRNQC